MPAEDRFKFHAIGWTSPFTGAFTVVPSDIEDFTTATRAVWVGGTGNVRVITTDGSVVTFSSVPSGTQLDIQAARITSTGTTATSMVGMY
jgi:hypothetical protein